MKKKHAGRTSIFTPYKDERITNLVNELPDNSWTTIANIIGTKTPKQIKDRYVNYINPMLKHSEWTIEEEILLLELYELLGSSWSTIEKLMPFRSRNDIRYKWMKMARNDRNYHQILNNKREMAKSLDKTEKVEEEEDLSLSSYEDDIIQKYNMMFNDPIFCNREQEFEEFLF